MSVLRLIPSRPCAKWDCYRVVYNEVPHRRHSDFSKWKVSKGEDRLFIKGFEPGHQFFKATATDLAGNVSVSTTIDFNIDSDQPVFKATSALGYRFGYDEPVILLSFKNKVDVAYVATDIGSGFSCKQRGERETCKIDKSYGRQCEITDSVLVDLSQGDFNSSQIDLSDCASPSGNLSTRSIVAIRPLQQATQQPMNVEAWLAEFARDPELQSSLLGIVGQISPRFGDLTKVHDADLSILGAWLNLASGRISPDKIVVQNTINCGSNQTQSPTTLFSLVKAVDKCIEVSELSDKQKSVLKDMLAEAYISPKQTIQRSNRFSKVNLHIRTKP